MDLEEEEGEADTEEDEVATGEEGVGMVGEVTEATLVRIFSLVHPSPFAPMADLANCLVCLPKPSRTGD